MIATTINSSNSEKPRLFFICLSLSPFQESGSCLGVKILAMVQYSPVSGPELCTPLAMLRPSEKSVVSAFPSAEK
jgi:hypothetical protein